MSLFEDGCISKKSAGDRVRKLLLHAASEWLIRDYKLVHDAVTSVTYTTDPPDH